MRSLNSLNDLAHMSLKFTVAQVSLSISVLNGTADGARIIAADYADAVISAVKQVDTNFPPSLSSDT